MAGPVGEQFILYGHVLVLCRLCQRWFQYYRPCSSRKTGGCFRHCTEYELCCRYSRRNIFHYHRPDQPKNRRRLTSGIFTIVAGIGYIIIGNAPNLAVYTIAMCFVVGGIMSAGYIAGGTLVAQWFPKKKGVVMGYTTMGHNLASAFYVPLITFLVGRFGVGQGVMVPAFAAIILGILGFLFIRNTPQERGLNPDNVSDQVYKTEYFLIKLKIMAAGHKKTLINKRTLACCNYHRIFPDLLCRRYEPACCPQRFSWFYSG